MSRREEVDLEIAELDDSYSARTYTDGYADLARTLAAEVDELRGKLDDVRMNIGCARGQRTTQFCAEAAQRDAVIDKLLDLVEPGRGVFGTHVDDSTISLSVEDWNLMERLHARACEIAGRVK